MPNRKSTIENPRCLSSIARRAKEDAGCQIPATRYRVWGAVGSKIAIQKPQEATRSTWVNILFRLSGPWWCELSPASRGDMRRAQGASPGLTAMTPQESRLAGRHELRRPAFRQPNGSGGASGACLIRSSFPVRLPSSSSAFLLFSTA